VEATIIRIDKDIRYDRCPNVDRRRDSGEHVVVRKPITLDVVSNVVIDLLYLFTD
jgi:hypothetical protein